MFSSEHDQHQDSEKCGRNADDLGNGKGIPKHGPPEISPEKFDHGSVDPVNGYVYPEQLAVILLEATKKKNQKENGKIGCR